jgi:hypothetical protein
MLFDQLYRWGSPVVTAEVKAAYGLDSGYGKASNFFAEKQAEFLSGLIYEDAQIRTLDGNRIQWRDFATKENGNILLNKMTAKYGELVLNLHNLRSKVKKDG